jgi:hypothetical protein
MISDIQTTQRRLRANMAQTPSGCQEWTGCRGKWGYGSVRVKQKTMLAHRVSYTVFVGPIPDGILVLHKCDNPPCINPDHLFLGTNLDNVRDRNAKGRTRGKSWHGETHPSAKLTEIDVAEIRKMAGTLSQRKIAQMFGIRQSTVSNISNFKTWKA